MVSDVGPIPTAVASQLRPHRTMIFNLGFDASVQLPGQSSQGIQLHLRRREKGSYKSREQKPGLFGIASGLIRATQPEHFEDEYDG